MVDFSNIGSDILSLYNELYAKAQPMQQRWNETANDTDVMNRELMNFRQEMLWVNLMLELTSSQGMLGLVLLHAERQARLARDYSANLQKWNDLNSRYAGHESEDNLEINSIRAQIKEIQESKVLILAQPYAFRKAEREKISAFHNANIESIRSWVKNYIAQQVESYLKVLDANPSAYNSGIAAFLRMSYADQEAKLLAEIEQSRRNIRYYEIAQAVHYDNGRTGAIMAEDAKFAALNTQLDELRKYGVVISYVPVLKNNTPDMPDIDGVYLPYIESMEKARDLELSKYPVWEEDIWNEIQGHIKAKEATEKIIAVRETQVTFYNNAMQSSIGNNDAYQMNFNLRDDAIQEVLALWEILYDDLEESIQECKADIELAEEAKNLDQFKAERLEVHEKDLAESIAEIEKNITNAEAKLVAIFQQNAELIEPKYLAIEAREKENVDKEYQIIKSYLDQQFDQRKKELIDEINSFGG